MNVHLRLRFLGKILRWGGEVNLFVEVSVNSKKENFSDFVPISSKNSASEQSRSLEAAFINV